MKDFMMLLVVIAAAVFGMYSCEQSDWYQRDQREHAAAEAREQKPHVIRTSDDGCTVYAWKATGGTYHYFTRCGSTVTTDRNYTESCGKGCTRHKTEQVVTEGNR